MKTELKEIEVQAVGRRDDDFSVQYAIPGQLLQQRGVELGEVTIERFEVAALDEDVVGSTKD